MAIKVTYKNGATGLEKTDAYVKVTMVASNNASIFNRSVEATPIDNTEHYNNVTVNANIYASEDTRAELKQPVETFSKTFEGSFSYASLDEAFSDGYNKLKTLPEFADAVDC